MSVHQYIGARYVPYYYENSLDPTSTEWEPNVNYEALTIVTLPNNHSYISKKAVPDTIGSPALNAEYWLDTGSYDAYIQNLQDQIDIINNTDLPGLQTQIDDINGILDRKFWYIGDSFLLAVNGWGHFLDLKLGKTGHVTAENGIGFVDPGANTGKTLDQLITDDTTVPDDITDVIIVAGVNDCTSLSYQATFGTKVENAINAVKAKAPNARIYVIFNATWFLPLDANIETVNQMIPWLFTTLNNKCLQLANVFCPASPFYQLQDAMMIDDGIHLTAGGYKIFADAIYRELFGIDSPNRIFNTLSNGIYFQTAGESGDVVLRMEGGANYLYNDPANPLTFTGSTYTDIKPDGTSLPVYPKYVGQFAMQGFFSFVDTSNQTHREHGVLIIYPSGKIRIAAYAPLTDIKIIVCEYPVVYKFPFINPK